MITILGLIEHHLSEIEPCTIRAAYHISVLPSTVLYNTFPSRNSQPLQSPNQKPHYLLLYVYHLGCMWVPLVVPGWSYLFQQSLGLPCRQQAESCCGPEHHRRSLPLQARNRLLSHLQHHLDCVASLSAHRNRLFVNRTSQMKCFRFFLCKAPYWGWVWGRI